MPDVIEYRLGQLEQRAERIEGKLDLLPDKLATQIDHKIATAAVASRLAAITTGGRMFWALILVLVAVAGGLLAVAFRTHT